MNNMFSAPVRPNLSLSTDPRYCDVLNLDMDARKIRLRISGMQVPTLIYADWCEPIYGLQHFSYNTFGPLLGSDNGRGKQSQLDKEICDRIVGGERQFRMELPRSTLYGGALDFIHDATSDDPAWASIDLHRTFEEYLRIEGMRRPISDLEKEWVIIESNIAAGRRSWWNIEIYPELTAPGEGGFLS